MNTQELKEKLYELQNTSRVVSYDGIHPADPCFIIDAETRVINIPESVEFLSAQYEQGAEKIYFEIDRYYKGEDLSIHTCVIQFINSTNEGLFAVSNMDLYSVPDKIVFSWTVENASTQFSGEILFSVRFYSINSDYCFTYNYNTLAAQSNILGTINVDNPTVGIIQPQDMQIWLDNLNNISNQAIQEMNRIKTAVEEISHQSEQLLEQSEQMHQDTQGLLDIVESKLDPSFGNAPPITSVAEGQEISVDDSADRNLVGMTLYGRSEQVTTTGAQLSIPITKSNNTYGVTIETKDNEVTFEGTYTDPGNQYRPSINITNDLLPYMEVGEKYIASTDNENIICQFGKTVEGKHSYYSSSITVAGDETLIDYRVLYGKQTGDVLDGQKVSGKAKIMINKGSSALPWEPYTGGIPGPNPDYPIQIESAGDDGDVEVMLRGKNLAKILLTPGDYEKYGAKVKINDDYSFTLDGTTSTRQMFPFNQTIDASSPIGYKIIDILKANVTYRIQDCQIYCLFHSNPNNYSAKDACVSPVLFTPDEDMYLVGIRFLFKKDTVYDKSRTYYPMITVHTGEESVEYEPYREQTLPLELQNGLNAIPVDSGGNYTDKNGQQWIADTIELNSDGSGKLVQRVKKASYNSKMSFQPNPTWDEIEPELLHYFSIFKD